MKHMGCILLMIVIFFAGAYLGTKYPAVDIGAKVLP